MYSKPEVSLHSTRRKEPRRNEKNQTIDTVYRTAESLDEVVLAWRTVYERYLETGLVSECRHRIHLVPQAVSPATLVVLTDPGGDPNDVNGENAGLATISAYPDIGEGLPLDAVYGEEMEQLRAAGRALTEVGLLADSRTGKSRCMETKFALMRWVYFYGLYAGQSDLVLGVHPRHVAFYRRFLGCDVFAAESSCPRVNDAPVVGLRLDLVGSLLADPRPRGIKYFLEDPISRSELANRFLMSWSAIEGTVIGDYLGETSEAPRYLNRLAQLDANPHSWRSGAAVRSPRLNMA